MALSQDEINALLKESKTRAKRTPRDVTEPREVTVWFKLYHHVADFEHNGEMVSPHCENPDCNDPRNISDQGRGVVAVIKNKMMCRYCFLDGWLSDAS
jgi:hypothetical protein